MFTKKVIFPEYLALFWSAKLTNNYKPEFEFRKKNRKMRNLGISLSYTSQRALTFIYSVGCLLEMIFV